LLRWRFLPAPNRQGLKIATDATFAPFEYTDDDGNLVGFDVDLMNAIAEKAGIEFEEG
jgi:polar amino acid transport system substrate-binding protein